MRDQLISVVNKLYKGGYNSYLLAQYVNREHWSNVIRDRHRSVCVDNMTDFSYSTCFTMFIHSVADSGIRVGNEEFNEYLKINSHLNGVFLQVSAIAPYAIVKYWSYLQGEDDTCLQESFVPFDEDSKLIGQWMSDLLAESGVTILNEQEVEMEVPDINLELKGGHVTIYNCLFEDSY